MINENPLNFKIVEIHCFLENRSASPQNWQQSPGQPLVCFHVLLGDPEGRNKTVEEILMHFQYFMQDYNSYYSPDYIKFFFFSPNL